MWVPVFPSRTALPLTRLCTRSPIRRPTRARRVIESSDSEGEHVEHANTSAQILQSRPSITKRPPAQNTGSVIDLTISSDEGENEGVAPTNARKVPKEPVHKVSSRATTSQLKDSPPGDENKFTIPLFADDPDDDEEDDDPMNKDDGSILVLYVASSTHLPQVSLTSKTSAVTNHEARASRSELPTLPSPLAKYPLLPSRLPPPAAPLPSTRPTPRASQTQTTSRRRARRCATPSPPYSQRKRQARPRRLRD